VRRRVSLPQSAGTSTTSGSVVRHYSSPASHAPRPGGSPEEASRALASENRAMVAVVASRPQTSGRLGYTPALRVGSSATATPGKARTSPPTKTRTIPPPRDSNLSPQRIGNSGGRSGPTATAAVARPTTGAGVTGVTVTTTGAQPARQQPRTQSRSAVANPSAWGSSLVAGSSLVPRQPAVALTPARPGGVSQPSMAPGRLPATTNFGRSTSASTLRRRV